MLAKSTRPGRSGMSMTFNCSNNINSSFSFNTDNSNNSRIVPGKRMIQSSLPFAAPEDFRASKKSKQSAPELSTEAIEEIHDVEVMEQEVQPIHLRLASHFESRKPAPPSPDVPELKLFPNQSQWAKSVVVLENQARYCKFKKNSGNFCNKKFEKGTSTTILAEHLATHGLKASDYVILGDGAKAKRQEDENHQKTIEAYAAQKNLDKQTVKVCAMVLCCGCH